MRISLGVAIAIILLVFWYLKDHPDLLRRTEAPATEGVSIQTGTAKTTAQYMQALAVYN
ncbi:MAG: hypothetical protein AB7H77_03985 [Bdellovibrionales bacterium]